MDSAVPSARFWAILIGQSIGMLFPIFISFIAFHSYGTTKCESDRLQIDIGLRIIGWSHAIVILTTIITALIFLWKAEFKLSSLNHHSVDKVLLIFLIVDIAALLFVVCQQGGLSRSFFLPLLLIIPTAYLAVVQPGNMKNTFWLLLTLLACLILAYFVSHNQAKELPVVRFSITDFGELDPVGYNLGVLLMSVTALIIPLVQVVIILINNSESN